MKQKKNKFLALQAEPIQLVIAFLGERLPFFMFTNRYSFKSVLQAQIDQYEKARLFQKDKLLYFELKLRESQSQSALVLQEDNVEDYQQLADPHWLGLLGVLREEARTPRCDTEGDETVVEQGPSRIQANDLIILRLYFTFMGLSWAFQTSDQEFTAKCAQFIERAVEEGRDLSQLFHPDSAFVVNEQNKKRVKSLLVSLQKEKLNNNQAEEDEEQSLNQEAKKLFEVFTNVMYDVLQLIGIIPNQVHSELQNQIEVLRSDMASYQETKNKLIDFKNLVA